MYIPAAATSLLVLFSMHETRLSPGSCVFVASQRLYSRACYIVYGIMLLCTLFCMWYAVAEIDCCFRKLPIASAVARINNFLSIAIFLVHEVPILKAVLMTICRSSHCCRINRS